ncbi:MAG TPA: sigma-54-dependent Fis family transcriptional regulator [Burkholderiales bacterium]|nr:sigma-54-dependent Fis family transcriptional regulator [Burkholderiales bacterium]
MSDVVTNHARHVYSVIQASSSADTGGVAGRVALSWKRCVNDYGLDPAEPREPGYVSAAELADRQARLADLLVLARPEMASLSQQIACSGYAIVLTDSDGVVLSCFAEPGLDSLAANSGLTPGAIWTERTQGTNALGTCLAERQPVVIHHAEHFLSRNIGLTCSAAPIFDHNGALIAVLDASGEPQVTRQHTLVLVSMAAQRIENRLFLHRFGSEFILRFHGRPDFVDSPGEGMIAFSAAGSVLAANRSACLQLGYTSPSEVIGRDIGELFIESAQVLVDLSSRNGFHPTPIVEARRGGRFFGTVRPPAGARAITVPRPPQRPARRTPPAETAAAPLDALDTGDPAMMLGIRRAKRVLDKDIPVLLCGETGSGKEVFAKAMHQSSERAGKPFVALNCASIPETLIESELFGYKAGAFTGAARDGRRGKIFLANGGTLFLDEIGDMPVQLQARLLRALEEREVLPLGGEEPIKVDIRLISATHCNLAEKIKTGEFRPDLYYRLHGLVVTLPPLRERGDRRELIRRILAEEAEDTPVEIEEAAMDRLDSYGWPGNLRELRNVLRTVLALREGRVITEFDLPEAVRTGSSPLLPAPAPNVAATAPASDLSPLENAEREALVRELDRHHWNITNVARRLKISRNTLYRKMQRLAIRDPNKKEKVLH